VTRPPKASSSTSLKWPTVLIGLVLTVILERIGRLSGAADASIAR
jgi:hypothetical protein